MRFKEIYIQADVIGDLGESRTPKDGSVRASDTSKPLRSTDSAAELTEMILCRLTAPNNTPSMYYNLRGLLFFIRYDSKIQLYRDILVPAKEVIAILSLYATPLPIIIHSTSGLPLSLTPLRLHVDILYALNYINYSSGAFSK